MKYLVFLASLVAIASAQVNFSGLPECAKGCIGTALPKQCSALDIGCICRDQTFLAGLSCCISKGCNKADQDATIKFANQLCATGQVTIGSTSLGCPATAAPTSSATGGAAAATSVSNSAASAISSQTSVAGSLASSASSAAASATGNGGIVAHGISGFGAAGAAAAVFAFL